MEIQREEKIVLLGASRGLGQAVHQALKNHPSRPNLYAYSRKLNGYDFSQRDRWSEYLKSMLALEAERYVYLAAGGPYGDYPNFEWKDHEWALNVSFTFPAFLLHGLLHEQQKKKDSGLKQILFVGSAIAEKKPDPRASMYCAAKHALRGLLSSVQLEKPSVDLRLFSPGYMDTPMLPLQSWPRQKGLARKVEDVAEELIDFMTQPGPKLISSSTD